MSMSVCTDLKSFVAPTGTRHTLQHVTEGWEIAGSGTRDIPGGYRVRWELRDGTTGSEFYRIHDVAEARYASIEARYA